MQKNRAEMVTIAESARCLVRAVDAGVLATHSTELPGYPFGSITPYALLPDGRTVIYLSAIAQHTYNILGDEKVCLTVIEPADATRGDRQAGGRVTIVGNALAVAESETEAISERYFNFFPASRKYGAIHDFTFFVIEPVRVRYIAGFGEIHWVSPEEWNSTLPEWQSEEASIVAHMNNDHAKSLRVMCAHYRNDASESARMLSLDPAGFHVQTPLGIHYLRFSQPCITSTQVRREMVRLAQEAAA